MASLYRKWRSQTFDDLIGQEHVARTLRNAVRLGRVAHAYLFTGPRGTGKTSTARILARAVNCLDPQDGNPCNVCATCVAAQEGRALDVIEIDAASNTSVENVRDLREKVAYATGEARYKVYIVDEVHRLSGAAFDAFLKTLEEPPPHVIFVFASTEPHKVPATITSRCQRFDFRRISPADTLARLDAIADAENLDVSEEALAILARSANGSLRDALGLLEQVASYSDGRIESEDARRALGLADPGLVGRLFDVLLDGRTGDGLAAAEAFFAAGGEPKQLLAQLVEYCRALMLATCGQAPADLDPGLREDLARHAQLVPERSVVAILRALTDAEFSPRYDLVPSLPFEIGYVQAALAAGARAVFPAPGAPGEPRDVREEVARPRRPVLDPPSAPQRPEVTPLRSVAPGEAAPPEQDGRRPAEDVPAPVPAAPRAPTPLGDAAPASVEALERAWPAVMEQIRGRNRSVQAVLKSGYLMQLRGDELTIGFLHDFHANYFADIPKRRVLEEALAEVVGRNIRVISVRTTREEIEALRGEGTVPEDDGFVEEVAERLRQFHAQQMGNANS